MAILTRLNEFAAIEFAGTYSADLNTRKLYVYNFETANAYQLVSDDSHDTSRNFSYSPYLLDTFLKSTPHPYYQNHDDREMSILLSDNTLPSIDYIKCKLHTVAGFKYDETTAGFLCKVYVVINGVREVALAAIADVYNNSRLTATDRNVVLDNVVFAQSVQFSIPDIQFLLNSTDAEVIKVREQILGTGITNVSNYIIEYSEFSRADISTFSDSLGYTQTRVTPPKTFTNYYNNSEYSQELVTNISLNTAQRYLTFFLTHSQYDLRQYLSQFMLENETLTIRHAITINYFNSSNVNIYTDALEIRNSADDYSQVNFKPILPELVTVDHALVEVRSTITNDVSGMIITRYASKVITNATIFQDTVFNVSVTEMNVKNVKNVVKHELVAPTDTPSVLQIVKPYYVMSQTLDTIKLLSADTAVKFDSLPVNTTGVFYLQFDKRKYKSKECTTTSAVFIVPALEYNKSTPTFYLLDGNGTIISYGTVIRIS
jgi:hypothetical protein